MSTAIQPWKTSNPGRVRSLLAGGAAVFAAVAALLTYLAVQPSLKSAGDEGPEPPKVAPVDTSAWHALPVQHDGRVKPFQTAAREIVRVITGRSKFQGIDGVDLVIAWRMTGGGDSDPWENYPFILCNHHELRRYIFAHKIAGEGDGSAEFPFDPEQIDEDLLAQAEEKLTAEEHYGKYIDPHTLGLSPGFRRLLDEVEQVRKADPQQFRSQLTTVQSKALEVSLRLTEYDSVSQGKGSLARMERALARRAAKSPPRRRAQLPDPKDALRQKDPFGLVRLDRVAGSGWLTLGDMRSVSDPGAKLAAQAITHWDDMLFRRMMEKPEAYRSGETLAQVEQFIKDIQAGKALDGVKAARDKVRADLETVKRAAGEVNKARPLREKAGGVVDDLDTLFTKQLERLDYLVTRTREAQGGEFDPDDTVWRVLFQRYMQFKAPGYTLDPNQWQRYPAGRASRVAAAFEKVREAYLSDPSEFPAAADAFFAELRFVSDSTGAESLTHNPDEAYAAAASEYSKAVGGLADGVLGETAGKLKAALVKAADAHRQALESAGEPFAARLDGDAFERAVTAEVDRVLDQLAERGVPVGPVFPQEKARQLKQGREAREALKEDIKDALAAAAGKVEAENGSAAAGAFRAALRESLIRFQARLNRAAERQARVDGVKGLASLLDRLLNQPGADMPKLDAQAKALLRSLTADLRSLAGRYREARAEPYEEIRNDFVTDVLAALREAAVPSEKAGSLRAELFAAAGAAANDAAVATPYPGTDLIPLEMSYNRVQPFMWAWILMVPAVALFAMSYVSGSKWLYGGGFLFTLVALGMQVYGYYVRVAISGRAPVSNMYETVIFVGSMTMVFALALEYVYRKGVIALAGSLVSLVSLVLADQLGLDAEIKPLVPVLRSNYWLIIHVLTIVASYAGGALAWGLGNVALGMLAFGNPSSESLKTLSRYTYRAIQIAVLLLATGTFLGGFWAADSWGRFWGWDPKETWALIALIVYVIPLHARYIGWVKDFGLAVASVVAFSAIVMCWYGVNFVLPAGLHSYGTGSGGKEYVALGLAVNMVWVFATSLIYFNRTQSAAGKADLT